MKLTGLCLLVVGVLVTGSATPAAGSTAIEADTVCNPSVSDRVVGVLPGGETIEREMALYPGTRLSLILCDGGKAVTTEAWSLESGDELSNVTQNPQSYTVEIGSQVEAFDVGDLVVERRDASGPRIYPQVGDAAATTFTGTSAVSFATDANRDRFVEAEEAYLEARTELEEHITSLNESTAGLQSSGVPNDASFERLNRSRRRAVAITETWDELQNHSAELEGRLYEAAWASHGGSTELDTLSKVIDDTQQSKTNARSALRSYQKSLQTVEQRLQTAVLIDFGFGLFPSLIVGAIAGAWYPHREGKRVAYDRQYSETEYGRTVVVAPLLVGVTVVVGALAGLGVVDLNWLGHVWEVLV